ncbi:MAG: hypothetical protein H7222_10005 [Methylotenera sp.]|nr:hypothetical protein [Oligoflexia bacterium]
MRLPLQIRSIQAAVLLSLVLLGAGQLRPAFANEGPLPCSLHLTKLSTAEVRGRRVAVQMLPADLYSKHDLSFLPADVRVYEPTVDMAVFNHGLKHQVLLGIQSPQHYYLIVDSVRYDARILAPSTVSEGANARMVGSGIVVSLLNLSSEKIELLKKEILKPEDEVSLSCAQGSLLKLAKAGIRLNDREGVAFRADDVMERILGNGLIDEQGNAIQLEFYQSGSQTLEVKLTEMKQWTDRMVKAIQYNFRDLSVDELQTKIGHPFHPEAEAYVKTLLLSSP